MGELQIGPRSEHGLAHVQPPRGLTRDQWVDAAWQWLAAHVLGIAVDQPDWLDDPAMTRHTITSPRLLAPFHTWNAGRPYNQQVKPGSFMLVAHVAPLGEPPGIDPKRIRLVAPYTSDRSQWESMRFRNLYDRNGPDLRITASRWDNGRGPRPANLVEVTTYRQLLRRYLLHPETKYASDGRGGQDIGWLNRLRIRPTNITTIGKETNKLADVQAGLHGAANELTAIYESRDVDLERALAQAARLSGRQLERMTGVNRRTLDRIRQRQRASASTRALLLAAATRLDQEESVSHRAGPTASRNDGS